MIFFVGTIGWGDASRALAIIKYLREMPKIVCNGHSYEYFEKMGIEAEKIDFKYIASGFSFYESIFQTLLEIPKLPKYYSKVKKLIEKDEDKIVVVIQDFFFTVLIPFFSRYLRKKVIITNIPRMAFSDCPERLVYQKNLAKAALEEIARNYDVVIYDNFTSHQEIRKVSDNIYEVGLIVDKKIPKESGPKGDFLHIFIGHRPETIEIALSLRKRIPDLVLIGAKTMKIKSLGFLPRNELLAYMKNSEYVISTAGIGTIADCLLLKKPMLLIPYRNHLEQFLNANEVEKRGFGKIYEKEKDLEIFLENLDNFKRKIRNHKINLDGAKSISSLLKNICQD